MGNKEIGTKVIEVARIQGENGGTDDNGEKPHEKFPPILLTVFAARFRDKYVTREAGT